MSLPIIAALLLASSGTWTTSGSPWRTDPVWHDGQAEKCVYAATRSIYGIERRYEAIAYTNKEHVDPRTTVKLPEEQGSSGLEVFKHHWSERIPTERYDYDFSTATFTLTEDLSAFKLTVGTQDDCGASFKQIWRDASRLAWMDSVYFPNTGMRQGTLPREAHFFDALTLLLRDYPFDAPRDVKLWLVPSQKSVQAVSFEPKEHVVAYAGRETINLPIGAVDIHRLTVRELAREEPTATYCFAADGAAPWLHVLAHYQGPEETSLALTSLERTAYWQR